MEAPEQPRVQLVRWGWRRWLTVGLAIALSLWLAGCSAAQPPLSLAPGPELVRRAIALQVERTQAQLSQQLAAARPQVEIRHVKIAGFEPLYLARLATYRVQGTYDLYIHWPDRETEQKGNKFDLYLQRQKEGKTWRWLNREALEPEGEPRWTSYLVR